MSWSEDLYAAGDAQRANRPPNPHPPTPHGAGGDGTTTQAADRALQGIARRLSEAVPGTRNALLNWASYRAGQYHAYGVLSEQDAKHAIYGAAYTCGLDEPEVTTTYTSGWTAGNNTPAPPKEAHTNPRYAKFTAVTPDEDEPDDDGDGLPQCLNWHELWADDTEDEWLLEPLIPARRLVALYSAPKVGKSLLMLEVAAGLAAGKTVLGYTPDHPITVLYVDYENDPRGDVRTRLQALGYQPDTLTQLRYLSYPVIGGLDTLDGARTLIGCVDREQANLVVVDTVSRAVEGEENENDTWLDFYRLTGLRLKQRGVACVRLDHSGKDETKGMRGGSAKAGDVDAIWRMSKITEEVVTLHCDDSRLLVAERDLTLRRGTDPLEHHVEARAGAAAWGAKVDDIVAWMDAAQMPPNTGYPALTEALETAGKTTTKNARKAACQERKKRLGILDMGEE